MSKSVKPMTKKALKKLDQFVVDMLTGGNASLTLRRDGTAKLRNAKAR